MKLIFQNDHLDVTVLSGTAADKDYKPLPPFDDNEGEQGPSLREYARHRVPFKVTATGSMPNESLNVLGDLPSLIGRFVMGGNDKPEAPEATPPEGVIFDFGPFNPQPTGPRGDINKLVANMLVCQFFKHAETMMDDPNLSDAEKLENLRRYASDAHARHHEHRANVNAAYGRAGQGPNVVDSPAA